MLDISNRAADGRSRIETHSDGIPPLAGIELSSIKPE
jgi:hypothetical protein